ncbi:MAG: hypothetical protein RI575_18995 [Balneolaceae bacterium]|nr:hypothetical protein [Balneolaceae bacterium]MDR9409127.1 hypothetical protein [Balneolaceae bacterium]
MRLLSITSLLTLFLIISCGESQPDVVDENAPLPEQIDQLIQANEYQTALSMLEEEDQTDPIIQQLFEKTHLNYGLYSMNTFDQTEMRTRMNRALTQFTEVLRINPENQVARTNINQILSIYKTIPERDPEPEVLDGLEKVGIEY